MVLFAVTLVNSWSTQGYDNNEPATARDVHVDIEDQPTAKDRLPPVRSTTPKKVGTPSPSRDRVMSRQSSDINKHVILPPINDSKQKVRVKGWSRDDDDNDDDQREGVREEAVVATAVHVARNERREKSVDREKKEGYVKREMKDEVEKIMTKERKVNTETEDVNTVHDKKEIKTKEIRRQTEKIENKIHESINDSEKTHRNVDLDREAVKEEKNRQKESKTRQKDNWQSKTVDYDDDDDENDNILRDVAATEGAAVAAALSSPVRQSLKGKSSSPSQQKSQKEPEPRRAKPGESPPKQSRASPEIPERSPWSRNKPKRKSTLEDEIERLDKMVDRDLNEIIRSLGSKSRNLSDNDKDSQLKKKIMDPTFQAGIDKYLRDI
ncbi:hypothetical protein BsWGS_25469 [Bradybaena similaris]